MLNKHSKRNFLHVTALAVVLTLALLSLFSCMGQARAGEVELRVHFLDVGQADSSLVEYGGESCMLIDTADKEHADMVCRYIDSFGYSKIDTLLITHPHSDHAGGAEEVLSSFEVGRILIPKTDYTTPELDRALELANSRGVDIITVDVGDSFRLGEAEATVLSQQKDYADENDASIILRLAYLERSFLFMGDCTERAEADLIALSQDISSDVVKVGHHGSGGSSSEEFVRLTGAKYAVISCSADNEYSHPSPYTVDRWRKVGATVLCTDECSDVVFTTDGNTLRAKIKNGTDVIADTQNTESGEYSFVLDCESHTVHKTDCRHVKNIEKENFDVSNADISRILAEGYRRCKYCMFD